MWIGTFRREIQLHEGDMKSGGVWSFWDKAKDFIDLMILEYANFSPILYNFYLAIN